MEIEVLSRRDNPLLKRTEVRFRVKHAKEPSPARDALRQELAKALKVTKDIVIIDGTRSAFGRPVSEGFAKIYKSKEDALRTERSFILVRNKLKEAEVKEKKAAPSKPPPKPAPEAKEAVKPAEKTAPAEQKREAPKAEAPKKEGPKKEAPGKKDEKPTEKKAGKGA